MTKIWNIENLWHSNKYHYNNWRSRGIIPEFRKSPKCILTHLLSCFTVICIWNVTQVFSGCYSLVLLNFSNQSNEITTFSRNSISSVLIINWSMPIVPGCYIGQCDTDQEMASKQLIFLYFQYCHKNFKKPVSRDLFVMHTAFIFATLIGLTFSGTVQQQQPVWDPLDAFTDGEWIPDKNYKRQGVKNKNL